MSRLYDVRITQCYFIENIEAANEDEARRKATEDYTWEPHLKDCIIDVEGGENGEEKI